MVALFREREESREVVARGLDGVGEDVEAVALGRASAGDRGDGSIAPFRDLGCRAGRVEGHLGLNPVLAQEFLDLRERLRMRARCSHIF